MCVYIYMMYAFMYGFCYRFNSLRLRTSQKLKDNSAAPAAVSFVSSETSFVGC